MKTVCTTKAHRVAVCWCLCL